jgi:predicted nucleic acid-binding protein
MRYLLDTCVVSELVSKTPDVGVVGWVDGVDEQDLFLSVITIGEIVKEIDKLPESARQQELRHWLEAALLPRFRNRILPIDVAVITVWGALTGGLEQRGRKMPVIEALIAATALHGELSLVTRNESDFRYAGVQLVNPWTLEG